VPEPVRLQGDVPAALLFIQAGEKQVHLGVPRLIRMRERLAAVDTLALMHGRSRHRASEKDRQRGQRAAATARSQGRRRRFAPFGRSYSCPRPGLSQNGKLIFNGS
jgi:hypothetical protein